MRNLFFCLILFPLATLAQTDSLQARKEITKFQKELDKEYRNPDESPLGSKAKRFKGHQFFPINLHYRVVAKLTTTGNTRFFDMKTSSGKLRKYRKYGIAEFTIDGIKFELPVYQSAELLKQEQYKDFLFFPFTDLTNGHLSYSAGRYIELRIPEGDHIMIDFNQAYNPYCAYSDHYSCPIVPAENHLEIEVKAGVMFEGH